MTTPRKVFVNGNAEVIRTLSPFSYKDAIKTLEKSNEARVTLDGARVFKSAVTKGRDVKSGSGALKFHLYFYPIAGADREFIPISEEEYRAYTSDAGYSIALVTASPVAPTTEAAPAPAAEAPEAPEAPAPRKAKREKATA